MLEKVAAVWLGWAVMATGSLQGKAAQYRVQRRGRAVVSSVRSREGRAGRNEKPRGSGCVKTSGSVQLVKNNLDFAFLRGFWVG